MAVSSTERAEALAFLTGVCADHAVFAARVREDHAAGRTPTRASRETLRIAAHYAVAVAVLQNPSTEDDAMQTAPDYMRSRAKYHQDIVDIFAKDSTRTKAEVANAARLRDFYRVAADALDGRVVTEPSTPPAAAVDELADMLS